MFPIEEDTPASRQRSGIESAGRDLAPTNRFIAPVTCTLKDHR